jgi:hypothetical protein
MKGKGKKHGSAPKPPSKSFGSKTEFAPKAKTTIAIKGKK